ncbi:MAG TPA: ABC transporter ATP-binding protein [Longimicrobiaceae bacterium]|nr:ABC transporter ATP-binding protein [Longimicrobiaceae bacterium]
MSETVSPPLLEVENLEVEFRTDQGKVRAVDGLTFEIRRGRTLGIVGESGCGKSVSVRAIMQLLPANGSIVGGRIIYRGRSDEGVDIRRLRPAGAAMRSLRGNEFAMIFQEPMTSLSPIYSVGAQIIEAVKVHRRLDRREARDYAIEMLRRVNIPAPEKRIDAYPHQLSGGMRQRVMIAMAISCHPKLLIADEPTTALDVTIEAQILNLIKDMQEEEAASLIMITHDLGVIAETADEVAVMYVGRVVETGTAEEVLEDPLHPYTQALLRSIPKIGRRARRRPIEGTVPSLDELPKGCKFADRCPSVMPICRSKDPPAFVVGQGREVRCWLHEEQAKAAS